jgi:hypothetical protein
MPDTVASGEQWEDRTISMVMANVLSLAVMLPLIALVVVPFALVHGWNAAGRSLIWLGEHLLLAVAVFVVSVVAHEGLHAAGWLISARVPRSEIEFGMRHLTPYAHTSATVEAAPYRIGIALPALLLGGLPAVLSWLTGSGVLMLYGALMLSAAAGDILILWLIRDVPASRLMQDHPTRAGCRVRQPR